MATRTRPRQQSTGMAVADDGEIRSQAAHMADAFLACRDLGHSWKPHQVAILLQGFERTMKCPRCKCLKIQVLSNHGHIESNRYQHAEGYLLEPGTGRVVGSGRDILRLEALARATTITVDMRDTGETAKSRAKANNVVDIRNRRSA